MLRLRPTRASVLLPAVLLLAGLSAAALVPREPKKQAREQIVALEEQWRQAQLADDVAAMDKLLSDDYLGVTSNGDVLTKNQQLDRMRNRQLTMKSLDLSDIKVKLIGQTVAIVNSQARVDGSNESLPLVGNFRYTRVYQRLPSGIWKITSFEVTRIHDQRNPQRATGSPPPPPPQHP